MRAVDIIRKKREGEENSAEEIHFLISGALDRKIPDYQVSAWLMAVFFSGMTQAETVALTAALAGSGEVVDWSDLPGPTIDKHSTGGVGDKTSLVVAPTVAAAGVYVPKITGRGLGHTGGTLDKLESIPGFKADLSLPEFRGVVRRCGLSLVGQTASLAPADKMLYALRDVTATVESIPLIVASIISKKVAEGVDGVVLDVKTGHGAFMKDVGRSELLAENLVETGRRMGKRVVAVISDMSQPLGRKIGNALEVQECVETLKGGGSPDLVQVCQELAAHMLILGGKAADPEEGRSLAAEKLQSGAALAKFRALVEAQGGDPRSVDEPELLMGSPRVFEYTAEASGYLCEARADTLGRAAMLLGAGRERVDSRINHRVGLEMVKKVGDQVAEGETLVKVYYEEEKSLAEALRLLPHAYRVSAQPRPAPDLIRKVVA